jgi:hypothetical protein
MTTKAKTTVRYSKIFPWIKVYEKRTVHINRRTLCTTCDGTTEQHYCPCNAELTSDQCEYLGGVCKDCR